MILKRKVRHNGISVVGFTSSSQSVQTSHQGNRRLAAFSGGRAGSPSEIHVSTYEPVMERIKSGMKPGDPGLVFGACFATASEAFPDRLD